MANFSATILLSKNERSAVVCQIELKRWDFLLQSYSELGEIKCYLNENVSIYITEFVNV